MNGLEPPHMFEQEEPEPRDEDHWWAHEMNDPHDESDHDWEVIAPQCADTYAILELLRETLLEDWSELYPDAGKDREAMRLTLDNLDAVLRVEGLIKELVDPNFLGGPSDG